MPRIEKLNQLGFTLAEVVATTLVGAIVAVAAMAYLVASSKGQGRARVDNFMSEVRAQYINSTNDDCSWGNTIYAGINAAATACLRNKTNCFGASGQLNMYDNANNLLYDMSAATNGIDVREKACVGFDPANGHDTCILRVETTWEAQCAVNPCFDPQIEIKTDFIYRPKYGSPNSYSINTSLVSFSVIKNFERIHSSCRAALASGEVEDKVYLLDPDGPGGFCPFRTHCDQTTDGGGWALVVNAPTSGYNSLAIMGDQLSLLNSNRLSDSQIVSLIGNRSMVDNNLRVKIGDSTIVSGKINSVPTGPAKFTVDDDSCTTYDPANKLMTMGVSPTWGFYSVKNDQKVGFSDTTGGGGIGAGVYNGFVCDACSLTVAPTCGLPMGDCCASSQRGSVWIR